MSKTQAKIVEIDGQKVVVMVYPESKKRPASPMKTRGRQTNDLDWSRRK